MKLAQSADPSVQIEALKAMVDDQKKAHVNMMINENAKSVQVMQACKNAFKKM